MIRPWVALLALFTLISIGATSLCGQDTPAARRAAIEGMYPVMIQALETKNFGHARHICDQAIIWEPQNPTHHYNLACIEAQAGGTRLPFAFGALELAIALGFDDPDHLKAVPDLAPIRSDPRFNELLRKATNNANAGTVIAAIEIPESKRPTVAPAEAAAPAAEKPAPASFKEGVPVGLYFMTRYWSATRTLEKAAWYFAPDGAVYENLALGFSQNDLAAHPGPKGTAKLAGKELEVTWSDGKKTSAEIEREGTGFIWDMGIFTVVNEFADNSEIVGVYEGGESLGTGGDRVAVSKRLELRADGTFAWDGVSFVGSTSTAGKLSAGSKSASAGQWRLSGYSLILTDAKGTPLRRIAFPYDDEKTLRKPDWMFFGGLMYKKQ